MLAQRDAPPTILQVCDRIGASPRKLEYCFRSVLGIAPAKYMRAARLNGVRRELRRIHGPAHDRRSQIWYGIRGRPVS